MRSEGQIFRLVGFNTPEFGLDAECASERALAAKATGRLQQLVKAGEPNLERVACACVPGTEGTRQCNHGRLCGRLSVDGRDVGSILIAEGLAERYECGATSCSPRTGLVLILIANRPAMLRAGDARQGQGEVTA